MRGRTTTPPARHPPAAIIVADLDGPTHRRNGGESAQPAEIRRAVWRNHRMVIHTLGELVATILVVLIASGSVIGGMFFYFKLRAKELEAQDSREAEQSPRSRVPRGPIAKGVGDDVKPPRLHGDCSCAWRVAGVGWSSARVARSVA